MNKNISVTVKKEDPYLSDLRATVAKLQGILDFFATDEGFEDFAEQDSIRIGVGTHEVDLYFSPQTWEAAERFIMHCICHLIEVDALDKFPYYNDLANKYAAALGEERGSFE